MELRENLDLLQNAADWKCLRNTLTSSGVGSIIAGLIAFASVLMLGTQQSAIIVFLSLWGTFLLFEGIWLIMARKPRPGWLIVDGIVIIVAGVANVVSLVYMANALDPSNLIDKITFRGVFFLGLAQIAWGIQTTLKYRRFSGVPLQSPSPEDQKWVEQAAENIAKAKSNDNEDIIELESGWKTKLGQETAIFVKGKGEELILAKKREVNLVSMSKIPLRKSLRVTLRVRNRTVKGIISPELLGRYNMWKSGNLAPDDQAVKAEAVEISPKSRLIITQLEDAKAQLILPNNTEISLAEAIRSIGRGDFERVISADKLSYISRQHLLISYENGRYFAEDLGSANGTKINGVEIKGKVKQGLNNGDRIDIAGVVTLTFKAYNLP